MPVYNTKEKFLRESIESILKQNFTDFEFIILNDGSTDENVESVILSYDDSRIKYIKQEKLNVAQTLNNGLDIAQGEYIARMDADDISLPERFDKQVKFLDAHPEVSLCGSFIEVFYPNGKCKVTKYIESPKILDCWRGCIVAHPTVMFRRQDFEKHNLRYNPDYKCEDYELWSRAMQHLKFHIIQEVLLHYRRHENNISFIDSAVDEQADIVRERLLAQLTSDEVFKLKLKKLLKKKLNIWQVIFSIRNDGAKFKIITILGITIRIKRK
jgi:glycosyltransferase involved in cell wall biosynthesis